MDNVRMNIQFEYMLTELCGELVLGWTQKMLAVGKGFVFWLKIFLKLLSHVCILLGYVYYPLRVGFELVTPNTWMKTV
ncbi:hypothetical protein M6B38_328200 [Iris pallida]|uniref:Uncharacterized protein n=1 Tax=Iris pallida TaxID=29817 RepID=A0AAX6H2R8_IRIPA|nr:hypothetical protein M6B38_122605 [Iris pallida]KAJ6836366.1 hypothetical protein M6B38_328200 [Iris pallida]